MNNKVISLLKDKNYVLPQYLLKNYKNIGLNSEELIFLIYSTTPDIAFVWLFTLAKTFSIIAEFSSDVDTKVSISSCIDLKLF